MHVSFTKSGHFHCVYGYNPKGETKWSGSFIQTDINIGFVVLENILKPNKDFKSEKRQFEVYNWKSF